MTSPAIIVAGRQERICVMAEFRLRDGGENPPLPV